MIRHGIALQSHIVMAYVVVAYIVMAYDQAWDRAPVPCCHGGWGTDMPYSYGLWSYGRYRYGLYSYGLYGYHGGWGTDMRTDSYTDIVRT